MANYSDIQHRFANKQSGKKGSISAGNVSYEGRNYYSYSTVFGQWLDMEKNVVAIFDGSTSCSSNKHKLYRGLFPDDVHVFPLDFGGSGYYGWNNCNLVSSYNFKDEDFKEYHRMEMLDHYVERIYDQFAAINGGTAKGLEKVNFTAWGYIEELCALYRDTTINKWLKRKSTDKDISKKRKMVRLLKDGERDVATITDALFGEGTFKKYWDYCKKYRKAADKKVQMEWLCMRLHIRSPYGRDWRRRRYNHDMSAGDIRNLTAKERIDLHFAALAKLEWDEHENERMAKYNKNKRNAYKWIVGFEPVAENQWSTSTFKCPTKVRNMYNGQIYDCGGDRIFGYYWLDTDIDFYYNKFRKSEDKEQWIREFYAKCEDVEKNRKALEILKRVDAHVMEKKNSYNADHYINDEYLRDHTTDEEFALCERLIKMMDKHVADEEAQARAIRIARERAEAERKAEEEFRAKVKQEQIDECLERGEEGCRDLWRKHLTDIHQAERETNYKGEFFMGGNVLLRFNLKKDHIETSKNIRIPVEVCKKMWKIVKAWHDAPKCFKPIEIDTKGSGKYTISSYENDILTAGCHKIAYAEMERMYNEIVSL